MDTRLTSRLSTRHAATGTRHHRARAVALFIGLLALVQAALAAVSPIAHDCGAVQATVTAASRGEAREACTAVAQAVDFFARQGLPVGARIDLHLVESLPPAEATSTRGGVYLHSQRRAYVLRRARWEATGAPFGLPMTTALYRSIIVHEVAHAIVASHFTIDRPDVTAHEYLAYAAQIDSLPSALRERILKESAPSTREASAQFNLFVLGMNPDRFATLAWRHWHQPENGSAFVQQVLAGQALRGG